jgi:ATP phosphoribosyltransferase
VTRADSKLTLALPKGRVLQRSLELLRAAGLNIMLAADERAMRHDDGDVRILTMRNSDVPVYVELGVADAGIVGKDVLLEAQSNLFEPVDLGFARCRLSLIRQRGVSGPINRVASKYPRLAQQYLKDTGSTAEVIPLAGNVELACLSGLADAVIDLVESGATLRANDLEEVDVILQSSARFVVNRASLKLKSEELRPLIAALRKLEPA